VKRHIVLLGVVFGLHQLGDPSRCPGQVLRTFSVTRPVAAERFLHVTLAFGGGTVVLVPAPAGELYGLNLRYDADRSEPVQQYDSRTGALRLGVAPVGGTGVRVMSRGQLDQTARFELSPDVPLALDATISASNATIDLGGMTLTELEIRSIATRATVDFSRPTRGACKSATFTVGAAEIEVRHLAQAGCEVLRVDGGVGGVSLRFDGAWRRELSLVVDLAMGELKLQLPQGTGVRLTGERFLAPFDGTGFVRAGDIWTTPGYERAPHKLTVELKASMVSIAVEWIEAR
jgi:hypothetical protein